MKKMPDWMIDRRGFLITSLAILITPLTYISKKENENKSTVLQWTLKNGVTTTVSYVAKESVLGIK